MPRRCLFRSTASAPDRACGSTSSACSSRCTTRRWSVTSSRPTSASSWMRCAAIAPSLPAQKGSRVSRRRAYDHQRRGAVDKPSLSGAYGWAPAAVALLIAGSRRHRARVRHGIAGRADWAVGGDQARDARVDRDEAEGSRCAAFRVGRAGRTRSGRASARWRSRRRGGHRGRWRLRVAWVRRIWGRVRRSWHSNGRWRTRQQIDRLGARARHERGHHRGKGEGAPPGSSRSLQGRRPVAFASMRPASRRANPCG